MPAAPKRRSEPLPSKSSVKSPPHPNPLDPDVTLLCKIGSIVVHAEELLSPKGHMFDRTAIEVLLNDPDVKNWIKGMGVYLPRKR